MQSTLQTQVDDQQKNLCVFGVGVFLFLTAFPTWFGGVLKGIEDKLRLTTGSIQALFYSLFVTSKTL
ncbi:hypothetical protein [Endozoicomonas sp. ALC020]|uniref:hypothetical protein n=1 Tax=unclassified Endozoicomonas TaxID=2644528 RepID=UPI003BB1B5FC